MEKREKEKVPTIEKNRGSIKRHKYEEHRSTTAEDVGKVQRKTLKMRREENKRDRKCKR